MGAVGASVSAASRSLGHYISFGMTAGMMAVLLAFMATKIAGRKKRPNATCWSAYGPVVLVSVATVFILADTTRHILQDVGLWQSCGSNGVFPRINETWSSESCDWSSSQYKCDNLCYVPGVWTDGCGPGGSGCGGPIDLHDFFSSQSAIDELLAKDVDDMCSCTDHEDMSHLSKMGVLFTIIFTYLGFVLLSVGVMWNADILEKVDKFKSEWKSLRDPDFRRREAQRAAESKAVKDAEAKAAGDADKAEGGGGECST